MSVMANIDASSLFDIFIGSDVVQNVVIYFDLHLRTG